MKYLLDTHVFLWLNFAPEKLPDPVLASCKSPETQLFISHVTPWEIQIKHQIGKLRLDEPISTMIKVQQEDNQMQLLPIHLSHIYALRDLPAIHRDPFDRLLISQAKLENMVLVTADQKIRQYDVEVVW